MKPEELKQLSDQYRQELKEYLEDPNAPFAVGFQLMVRFSIKVSLIHMIGEKRNQPRMRAKMDYELAKIAERDIINLSPYADKRVMKKVHPAVAKLIENNSDAEAKVAEEIEFVASIPEAEKAEGEETQGARLKVITDNLKITPEEMPAHIRKEWDKARRYYHIATSHHAKMKVVETDEERAKSLKLCKEYEDLNKAAWAVIDAWAAEGKPKPEPKAEAPKLPADVNKAIGAAKSYISREAKKLDKKEGKQLERLRDMLTKKIKVLTDNKIAIPQPQTAILKKHGLIA